ncbi:MAG: 3-oxosteroid 1-dehydrogenase [Mycobacterium sp.]|jgi:3-oxosteroid 1-dehydrogenase|nr:3-oxosteroid 1-dehydrogenase [Mycobacterium sp.]
MRARGRKVSDNAIDGPQIANGDPGPTWHYEIDYLVAGTGVAGLSAAITAKRNGLETLIVESTDKWGGTTGMSGGGLWAPNNPLMVKAGVEDSVEAALHYMEQTIGDVGPWTSRDRKLAFLNTIPHYIDTLGEEGVKWVRAKDYPDYYPDLPGGRVGRGLEVKPFNVRKLGKWRKTLRTSLPAPLMTDDVWLLSRAWSTPSGFIRGAFFVFRTLGGILTGQLKYGLGGALAGSLLHIVLRQETPVWLNSPLTELIVENGRVVGAVVDKEGEEVHVRSRRGVMLAAGGFARNKQWRQKCHGVPGWTSAPEGQLGQGIAAGEEAGGALGMMDDAWWGAAAAMPGGSEQYGFLLHERSAPWSIVVDQKGNRYLNESESYIDFGHHMLEHDKKTPAIPSWLVTDHRHATRFLNPIFRIPGAKKKLAEQGEFVSAPTLRELAAKMKVDQETFLATVERFNGFAREGVDRDFQRGRTIYDQYYSHPLVKPNPNLGAIEKGPFRALKVYPGDLNTKGGLVTDEYARVLRKDGSIIDGLYAAGNNTASVMGHTYPGPGSTIAPAAIFGFLGALHAAQQAQNRHEE